MMKSQIQLESIRNDIVSYDVSFWAMQFKAILEAIQNQIPLSINSKIHPNVLETRSLASLYQKNPYGFFVPLVDYLQNWALQYLLCYYLKSSNGIIMLQKLYDKLSEVFNTCIPKPSLENTSIQVVGKDSLFCNNFWNDNVHFVFASNPPIKLIDANKDVAYVDLCIYQKTECSDYENIAILGEVEGNHGKKMFRNSYWEKPKSPYCVFGIGVCNKSLLPFSDYYTEVKDFGFLGKRVLLVLGSKAPVIDGLSSALYYLNNIFQTNRFPSSFGLLPELAFVLDTIKRHWNKTINELILELGKYVSYTPSDTIILIGSPSQPSIIQ